MFWGFVEDDHPTLQEFCKTKFFDENNNFVKIENWEKLCDFKVSELQKEDFSNLLQGKKG